METKSNRSRMEMVGRQLGFQNAEIVEAKGLAGGLAFFWKENHNIELLWSTERVICLKASNLDGSKVCNLIGCYGSPYLREKKVFGKGWKV